MSADRAIELQEQAWNLQAEGKLGQAREVCREALRLIEESEGPDTPDTANLLNDLADIERELQNLREALAYLKRAQAITDALGAEFTGETATRIRGRTLELMGDIQCKLGDYTQAEADLRMAWGLAAAEFGKDSVEAAESSNNLAVLLKHSGRFDEALQIYYRALPIMPEESLESATLYHNIGGILHAQGRYEAAEQPSLKAWEMSRRLLGEEEPRTMLDAVAYAAVLDGLGRYDESEPIYRCALAIFERAFGPQHYEVATTLHNLAALLAARGHVQEAELLYRRALATKEQLLGAESPEAALTRHNLGSLLNRTGRYAEAVPLLASTVAILETRLTQEHPHLTSARKNLQEAVRNQGTCEKDELSSDTLLLMVLPLLRSASVRTRIDSPCNVAAKRED